jgi:phosphatidylglycerophosphate synthase
MLLLAAFGASGLIAWGWVAVGMGANFLVSYTRAKAGEVSNGKVRLAVGIVERGERIMLIGGITAMAALGWWTAMRWSFDLLVILSLVTVGQRVAAARKAL